MTTDLYCVMGNPVEHSKSPWIHARFAQLTGQDLKYVKRLIPFDGFAQSVQAFRAEGGKGCNITVPFKFEAAPLATQLTPRAQLAGACNTLRFDGNEVFADNTDGVGLANDIARNAGVDLAGRDVLLIGAGGAASGVLGPLIEARPRRIVVANRTQAKAGVMLDRHWALAAQHGVQLEAPELRQVSGAFDVVINATTTSMSGAAVPVPAERAQARRARLRHDVRPRCPGLPGLGEPAWRRAARRAGDAGGTGGRGLPDLARGAPALGAGAGRAARHAGLSPR